MRLKKIWQFQNLESRRLLAVAIGDLDHGLAPYAQQATHVVGGAWLGDQIGHTIPVTDELTDRLFEPEVDHGPIRLGGDARQTLIADVNGDSLPDLVTLSYDHLLTQLRQVDGTYAKRTYTDLTSYSGDSHCYAEAFTLSDTNSDGKHEAIVPCHSSLLVLSADQQGTFNNLLFLDLRYVPTDEVESADINDDGIADFIFLSYQGISETIVYVGDGNGSLSRVPFSETVTALVTQAHLEDTNDDGFADLIVALGNRSDTDPIDYELDLWIKHGNGDGTFGTLDRLVSFDSNRSFLGFEAADLNQDGRTDLITSSYESRIEVWYGQSTGYSRQIFPTADFVLDVKVREGNLTNPPIIYVAMQVTSDFPKTSVQAYAFQSDNSLQPLDTAFAIEGREILLANATGDQVDDILIASTSIAAIFETSAQSTFQPPVYVTLQDSPRAIASANGDFNEDGYEDVIFTHELVDHFTMVLGNADFRYQQTPSIIRYPLSGQRKISDLRTIDFNRDGHLDLIGHNRDGLGTIVRLAGNGDGTFQIPQTFSEGSALVPGGFVVGDINGDAITDVVTVGSSSHSNSTPYSLWFGDGAGGFTSPTSGNFFPGTVSAANSKIIDGGLIIVFDNGVIQRRTFGSGTNIEALLLVEATHPIDQFLVANLNQDNQLDFVVSYSTYNQPLNVYLSQPNSYALETVERPGYTLRLSASDMTGDGIDEVLFEADRNTSLLFVRDEQIESSDFSYQSTGRRGRVSADAIVDLDGDGWSDLVSSNLLVRWGRSSDNGSSFADSPLVLRGESNRFHINANAGDQHLYYVHAWVDFDQDGTWSDVEKIVDAEPANMREEQSFGYVIPESAALGQTWARVRLSDSPFTTASGTSLVGEVEDYPIKVIPSGPLDFGDAPSALQSGSLQSYPTLLEENGARHLLGGPRFSEQVESETDGVHSALADLEEVDQEIGVGVFDWIAGSRNRLGLYINDAPGYVSVWLDANRDGDWDDPGERILTGYQLTSSGIVWQNVDVPHALAGQTTYLRARVSSREVYLPTGLALDGEVVDIAIDVAAPATSTPPKIVLGSEESPLRVINSGRLMSVHLSSDPGSQMSVSMEASPSEKLIALPAELSFDSDNWMIPQFVLVRENSFAFPSQTPDVTLSLSLESATLGEIDSVSFVVRTNDFESQPPIDSHVEIGEAETIHASDSWTTGDIVDIQGSFVRQILRGSDVVTVGGPSIWQNPINPYDVNRNGNVSPIDALNILNEIARRGIDDLALGIPDQAARSDPRFYDVTGDSTISPLDALRVINHLALLGAASGEGEFASTSQGLMSFTRIGNHHDDETRMFDEAISELF